MYRSLSAIGTLRHQANFSVPRTSPMARFAQPRSSMLCRSFAEEAKKPQKSEQKSAAPQKPAAAKPAAEMPKTSFKDGYDLFKTAPSTPPDPNNPFHIQNPGQIGQSLNEIPQAVKNIAEAIARLNLVELAMLNKLMDDRIGVPDDLFKHWLGSVGMPVGFAPAQAAAAPGAPGAAGAGAGAAGIFPLHLWLFLFDLCR